MQSDNSKFKIKKKRRGFTLIELLVSIAIVGLIATVTVINFRAGQKRDELNLAARQMVSDIRGVQIDALSEKLIKGETPDGGYGIYFPLNGNFYIYFADKGEKSGINFKRDVTEDIKTYKLPAKIKIISTNLGTAANVVFVPPRPVVYIEGKTSSQELDIVLGHEDLSSKDNVTVVINPVSGRIDIE